MVNVEQPLYQAIDNVRESNTTLQEALDIAYKLIGSDEVGLVVLL